MGSCASRNQPPTKSSTPNTTNTTQSKRAKQSAKLEKVSSQKEAVRKDSSASNSRNDGTTEEIETTSPGTSQVASQVASQGPSHGVSQVVSQGVSKNDNSDSLLADESALVPLNDKDVKILLLGSGESGKSTIVKQMKIIHKGGFSQAEAYDYRPFVYKNVLDCIKNIINAIFDFAPEFVAEEGAMALEDEQKRSTQFLAYSDLQAILNYEHPLTTDESFNVGLASKIAEIYTFPSVQEFIKRYQSKFYLIDSSDYFLTSMDRIAAPDYIPSQADILRTRKKTSGIFDFKFEMGSSHIHMFDVGGQRSERKKWIHCFDNVTLIIFCVALSEYDQVLLEESTQNRLEESLALFDSVVNSRWFSRTSVVLFLNKIDVFASKLPNSPLEKQFPDYNGGENINKAVKYILWRFTQVNRSGLNVYPHVTQATDTSNIQLVFAALKETILENTLRDSGIL